MQVKAGFYSRTFKVSYYDNIHHDHCYAPGVTSDQWVLRGASAMQDLIYSDLIVCSTVVVKLDR